VRERRDKESDRGGREKREKGERKCVRERKSESWERE
jgi:hypothetical protein